MKKPEIEKFMEKFNLLHQGEETLRTRSIEAIYGSENLKLHIELCESAADAIYYLIHCNEHADEDDLTIRLLGIRIFNCLSATLNLLLSGYYQNATLQMRDMLETAFLINYMHTDRTLIERWRTATPEIRYKEFSPRKVRDALDLRDGYEGKKRAEAYKAFCELAGHPNPRGFAMFQLPDGNHHCGPFFDPKNLDAVLLELQKPFFRQVIFLRNSSEL